MLTSFITKAANHCALGSFANYLINNNIHLSEAEIFFLGSNKTFELIEEPFKLLSLDIFDAIFSFHKATGISMIAANATCLSSSKNLLSKSLAKKNWYISINVSPTECTHYNKLRNLPELSLVHYINPIEIKNDKLLISDCCIPNIYNISTFCDFVSLDEILQAWKSTGFEYFLYPPPLWGKIKNLSIYLEKKTQIIIKVRECLNKLLLIEDKIIHTNNISVTMKGLKEIILSELFKSDFERFLIYLYEVLKDEKDISLNKISIDCKKTQDDFKNNNLLLLKAIFKKDQNKFDYGLMELVNIQKNFIKNIKKFV